MNKITEMRKVSESILIKAPRPEVFEYASDWQRWPDWFEGVSIFRPVTSVSRGNGAHYAYRARMFGIPASVETEIHDFVVNVSWAGKSTKGVPHTTQWIFEDEGDATKFTYVLQFHVPVPVLGNMLDSFMEKEWRRILKNSLKNLSAHFSQSEPIRRE